MAIRKPAPAAKLQKLKSLYEQEAGRAARLLQCVDDRFEPLLKKENITLAVPRESRVKSWLSIAEKIKRKQLEIDNVLDLQDLAGLRIIPLFAKDLEPLEAIVNDNFDSCKLGRHGSPTRRLPIWISVQALYS